MPIHIIHEAATVDAFNALIPVTVLTPIYHVYHNVCIVYSSTLALNNEHSLYIITSTIVQNHCTP